MEVVKAMIAAIDLLVHYVLEWMTQFQKKEIAIGQSLKYNHYHSNLTRFVLFIVQNISVNLSIMYCGSHSEYKTRRKT